jgi:hypothetical protein
MARFCLKNSLSECTVIQMHKANPTLHSYSLPREQPTNYCTLLKLWRMRARCDSFERMLSSECEVRCPD